MFAAAHTFIAEKYILAKEVKWKGKLVIFLMRNGSILGERNRRKICLIIKVKCAKLIDFSLLFTVSKSKTREGSLHT